MYLLSVYDEASANLIHSQFAHPAHCPYIYHTLNPGGVVHNTVAPALQKPPQYARYKNNPGDKRECHTEHTT